MIRPLKLVFSGVRLDHMSSYTNATLASTYSNATRASTCTNAVCVLETLHRERANVGKTEKLKKMFTLKTKNLSVKISRRKKLNCLQPDGAVHIHKNMNWSQVRFLTKTTNTEESFPKECRCLHCFDGKRILFKKLSNTFLA